MAGISGIVTRTRAILSRAKDGALNLAGVSAKLAGIVGTRVIDGGMALSGIVAKLAGLVGSRLTTGRQNLSGVSTRLYFLAFRTKQRSLSTGGLVKSRFSILARAKDGILNLAGISSKLAGNVGTRIISGGVALSGIYTYAVSALSHLVYGTLNLSGVVSRLAGLLAWRTVNGTLNLSAIVSKEVVGELERLCQGTLSFTRNIGRNLIGARSKDGSVGLSGTAPSRSSLLARTKQRSLTTGGVSSWSLFGLGVYAIGGILNLAAVVTRLVKREATKNSGSLGLSGDVLVKRGQTWTAHLNLSGILTWIISARAYATAGILNLSSTVSRWLNLGVSKAGSLGLSGFYRYHFGQESASYGAMSSLTMSGVATRYVVAARTKTGTLTFTQPEFGLDFWKEELYYGIRNP